MHLKWQDVKYLLFFSTLVLTDDDYLGLFTFVIKHNRRIWIVDYNLETSFRQWRPRTQGMQPSITKSAKRISTHVNPETQTYQQNSKSLRWHCILGIPTIKIRICKLKVNLDVKKYWTTCPDFHAYMCLSPLRF